MLRQELRAAIESYEQAIGELSGRDPGFPEQALGAGFTDNAQALSASLRHMHELSLQFLHTRVQGWRELIALMDSVEATDADSAGQWVRR